VDGKLDWTRLADLIQTSAFDCHYTSEAAGREINGAGFPCTWQKGDLGYRGITVFRMGGTPHEWLVLPGTDGEKTLLDFTIGYHLAARSRITIAVALSAFNPLWVVSHPDFQYRLHEAHYWDALAGLWVNPTPVNPPVLLWSKSD